MKFNRINWRSVYKRLEIKQIELIKAYPENNMELVKHIQILILKDFRTTAIAVRRVYINVALPLRGLMGKL